MGLRIIILISVTLIFSLSELRAQKKLKQGFIHYKVTAVQNIDVLSEEMKPDLDQMGIKIYFKDNLIRTEGNMGLQNMTTIENTDSRVIYLLMDMTGPKWAIRFTKEQMIAQLKLQGEYGHTIEYTDESKKIAGYNCKLAIITFDNSIQMYVYYTNKIAYANKNYSNNFHKLDGFPIQYITLGPNGTEIEYTATVIKKKLSNPEILQIPADYKHTTMSKLQSDLNKPQQKN